MRCTRACVLRLDWVSERGKRLRVTLEVTFNPSSDGSVQDGATASVGGCGRTELLTDIDSNAELSLSALAVRSPNRPPMVSALGPAGRTVNRAERQL